MIMGKHQCLDVSQEELKTEAHESWSIKVRSMDDHACHGIGPGHGFEVSQSARLVFGSPPPDSLPSANSNEGVAD